MRELITCVDRQGVRGQCSKDLFSLSLSLSFSPCCRFAVGQAGNQIASAFWETIIAEHGLNDDGQYVGNNDNQLAKIGVFFEPSGQEGKYVPR
jgi:hypothetical protein